MLRPEGSFVGGWGNCPCPAFARMLKGFPVNIQTVNFAPPEGFMDVDTSAPKERRGSTAESITSAGATSALQEVAANLANVKSAIHSGAADRNQVIDMLTNLLRETLQVRHDFCIPCNSLRAPCHLFKKSSLCAEKGSSLCASSESICFLSATDRTLFISWVAWTYGCC